MPTISVIVPVYKVEPYLQRCLDSILAQTFTDFELILVDDGSPDNCGKICDNYASMDNRVVVIHKKNGGVSTARNVGTEKANGNYVTYIDADDWITEDYLERLYAAVITFGADIAVTHPIGAVDKSAMGLYLGEKIIPMNPREAILRYAVEDADGIRNPWGKLIHREIAQNVRFPVDRHYAEDTACVYKWYWKAKRIVDIQDKLYFYFSNISSATRVEYSEKRLGEYETLREMISFFAENGFDELYQNCVSKYLIKAVVAYQYLRTNDTQLAGQVYGIIQDAIKMYLQSDVVIENCTQLLEVYKEKDSDRLLSCVKTIFSYLTCSLPTHIEMMGNNEYVRYEKKCLKMLILRYGRQCHFDCKSYPVAYEAAFPHLMKYYWIILAQIEKLMML